MNLSDIKELDFNNMGSWPVAAKAAFIGFLCVAVLGAGYWFDTRHQLDSLARAEAKEMDLKKKFKDKQAKAANLEAYKEQLAEMRKSFGAMLRQLPSKAEVAELLVDISQTGLASGLEFELFKPQGEQAKDFYAELPIEIRVVGSYHEFGKFVSGVAALPRIVTLHDIKIEPGKQGNLVMELTAKTYRYLENQNQKTGKQAEKGRKGNRG